MSYFLEHAHLCESVISPIVIVDLFKSSIFLSKIIGGRMSILSIAMKPLLAPNSPANSDNSVDFPSPFPPTTPIQLPCLISILYFFKQLFYCHIQWIHFVFSLILSYLFPLFRRSKKSLRDYRKNCRTQINHN